MGHIRDSAQPAQYPRKLLEIGHRHRHQYMGRTCLPIGRRSHSLHAQPLQCQNVRHISHQLAAVEGVDRDFHDESRARLRGPLHFEHALRLYRSHPGKAGTVAAMYRDTPSKRYVTCYWLWAQGAATPCQRRWQIADALDLYWRAAAASA